MHSFILSQWRDLRMGVIWEDLGALTTVRSNHEYTLSEPTAVANIAAWIHLRTFPSVEDTLPHTTRFFNTWKNSSSVNASQYSSRFTGSHHDYILSEPGAVVVLTDSIWTPFDPWNMLYHRQQGSSHLERRFCHKGKSTFGPFVLDHTMNSQFLSPLQWLILLYGSTWKPFHPWKILYHVPQGSSIPGKTVLPWTPVSIVAVLLDHTMNTHFLSPD